MNTNSIVIASLVVAVVGGASIAAYSGDTKKAADSGATKKTGAASASDLAKQTQNPVADLISVPFQFNWFFGTGDKSKTKNTLLIEPVIPLRLNDEWNFIARPITAP